MRPLIKLRNIPQGVLAHCAHEKVQRPSPKWAIQRPLSVTNSNNRCWPPAVDLLIAFGLPFSNQGHLFLSISAISHHQVCRYCSTLDLMLVPRHTNSVPRITIPA